MESVPLEIREKHNVLLVKLCDLIEVKVQSWTNFIGFLKNAKIPAGRLHSVKNQPMEVFSLMEERGLLKVGDYKELKKALKVCNMIPALDLVNTIGSEITTQMKGQGSTTIGAKRTRAESDDSDRSSSKKKIKIETQGTSTAGDDSPSNEKKKTVTQGAAATGHGSPSRKKRKQGHFEEEGDDGDDDDDDDDDDDEVDDEIGESSKELYELYDKKDKKGFLLILNFTENRDGTHHDVTKLKNFFEETLGFEVIDPREDRDTDLSLSELNKVLENTRRRLNKSSKQYYCFFCAILSHGSKEGILCRDKMHKPIDEIRTTFNNDKMENFVGKPKVFLIEACRGDSVQRGHAVPDNWPGYISDVSGTMSVPTDADVLIAYATTPGYVAWRETDKGTWFIQETIAVFEKHHVQEHLEELFIKVRNRIAKDKRYRQNKNMRMMPCTWSTLTQKLMI